MRFWSGDRSAAIDAPPSVGAHAPSEPLLLTSAAPGRGCPANVVNPPTAKIFEPSLVTSTARTTPPGLGLNEVSTVLVVTLTRARRPIDSPPIEVKPPPT